MTQNVRSVRGMDMSLTISRNKNKGKELIDWDLNIFMPELYDAEADDYYYDPASWKIHVYAYRGSEHNEWDDPVDLTAEEIQSLGLNRDDYFKDEVDVWYGLDGFRLEYWDKMSDRLKEYFDKLPKYWEDMREGTYGDRL
ncbi:MAG: hypothetical protein EBS31_00480 [Burkholderiaceae bacterium]|nr:hypothetical protein [Burkholderiaceae bacterium]